MEIQIRGRSTNRNLNENEKSAPIPNEYLNLNFNNKRRNNDIIQNENNKQNENNMKNVETLQNLNEVSNLDNSPNENGNKRQDYYSIFFKISSMVIECIFCIAFIVFEKVIKNKHKIFNAHYTGITTISSFFLIFFILFVIDVIVFCNFTKKYHLFGRIFFWLAQVFYFIDLFMIPSYYGRMIYMDKEEISGIKKRYIALIIISQLFALFIIFFDFIIINLYKDLCCEMDLICDNTFTCLNDFGKCIKDIISRIICQSKNEEDEEIKKIVQKSEDQKKQMNELNEEIKHLLLNIKKRGYLLF